MGRVNLGAIGGGVSRLGETFVSSAPGLHRASAAHTPEPDGRESKTGPNGKHRISVTCKRTLDNHLRTRELRRRIGAGDGALLSEHLRIEGSLVARSPSLFSGLFGSILPVLGLIDRGG